MPLSDPRVARPWRAALCTCLFALAGCASQSTSIDRGEVAQTPTPEELEAEMERALSLGQPGPEHAELMGLVGEWEVQNELQMAPGTDPVTELSRMVARSALGGRFLELRTSGQMFGMPTESVTYLGFDRRREVYMMVGLDTLGTYFVTAEGPRDADGVIRMQGRDPDPSGDQVYTFEMQLEGADAYTLRIAFDELMGQRFDPPYVMVTNRAQRRALAP
ncbi:MAG: DUF1579 family protein [Planctomycetota bacterium]